jgi:hypothetical protein
MIIRALDTGWIGTLVTLIFNGKLSFIHHTKEKIRLGTRINLQAVQVISVIC